jgi:hypothetical protein
MGIMKTAAVRGIIPAGNKVSELRGNLIRLITEMSVVLEERFGEDGLEAVGEIFRRLGEQDAVEMKERLGFGDSVRDAYDAWAVIGHVMGSKMAPHWVSGTRVEVDHTVCPQYDSFSERGKMYCEYACLPYVGAVGEGIAPGVKMDVVRQADNEGPCTKALEMKE